jgi:hypothetical protein
MDKQLWLEGSKRNPEKQTEQEVKFEQFEHPVEHLALTAAPLS